MPYPTNPDHAGRIENYTFFEPLPFIVLAQLVVGQELLENTGGQTSWVTDRLYIQPGVMIKFDKGSALDVLNPGASLNVGSRSYINGFDQNNGYSPSSPGFVDESASDPQVLFTSIYDDTATTTLVPDPINVTGETTDADPGPGDVGQRRHPERRHRRDQRGHLPVRRRRGQHARTSRSPRSRCWRSSPTTPYFPLLRYGH